MQLKRGNCLCMPAWLTNDPLEWSFLKILKLPFIFSKLRSICSIWPFWHSVEFRMSVSSIFIVILWVSLYFHFSRWMPSVTHPLEQSYRRLSKTSTDLFLAPSCEHHAFVKQNHPASLGWGSCEWRYELQILWAILTSFCAPRASCGSDKQNISPV